MSTATLSPAPEMAASATQAAPLPPKLKTRFAFPAHWTPQQTRKPAGFSQPTHILFQDEKTGLQLEWNSRAHRKGKMPRPTGVVTNVKEGGVDETPWKKRRAFPRFWGWDLGDISWWVGVLFTIGSVFWCANGIMFFDFFNVTTYHIGLCESITAFIGGTLFIVGAYLSYVESLNPALDAYFGWEIDQELHQLIEPTRTKSTLGRSRRHFGYYMDAQDATNALEKNVTNDKRTSDAPQIDSTPTQAQVAIQNANMVQLEGAPPGARPWRWYGADWSSFGFVANAIQLFGASIFWLSVLTGLPGILVQSGTGTAESIGLWEGLFWVPQIIGAPCFVISAAMFMFEVQTKWYIPNLTSLGWHVGFWNMLGGWGFWFSGIFGVWREIDGKYQRWGCAFSTWWGSWAFLIGSYIQLYETLNKL